jgi:hypothetical protein
MKQRMKEEKNLKRKWRDAHGVILEFQQCSCKGLLPRWLAFSGGVYQTVIGCEQGK